MTLHDPYDLFDAQERRSEMWEKLETDMVEMIYTDNGYEVRFDHVRQEFLVYSEHLFLERFDDEDDAFDFLEDRMMGVRDDERAG
jgi:hypothetical protein